MDLSKSVYVTFTKTSIATLTNPNLSKANIGPVNLRGSLSPLMLRNSVCNFVIVAFFGDEDVHFQ